MRITGFRDVLFGSGYYFIDATLHSVDPLILRNMRFMVDTGCQITTISYKDSLPFFEYVPSPTSFTAGVGGSTPISTLYNCGLSFDLVQSVYMERLFKINILNPVITPQNFNDVMRLPSTLGMDILSRYYLNFDTTSVTLEK